jgi:hypothetical protein
VQLIEFLSLSRDRDDIAGVLFFFERKQRVEGTLQDRPTWSLGLATLLD